MVDRFDCAKTDLEQPRREHLCLYSLVPLPTISPGGYSDTYMSAGQNCVYTLASCADAGRERRWQMVSFCKPHSPHQPADAAQLEIQMLCLESLTVPDRQRHDKLLLALHQRGLPFEPGVGNTQLAKYRTRDHQRVNTTSQVGSGFGIGAHTCCKQ